MKKMAKCKTSYCCYAFTIVCKQTTILLCVFVCMNGREKRISTQIRVKVTPARSFTLTDTSSGPMGDFS